jgi:hypothetical protein
MKELSGTGVCGRRDERKGGVEEGSIWPEGQEARHLITTPSANGMVRIRLGRISAYPHGPRLWGKMRGELRPAALAMNQGRYQLPEGVSELCCHLLCQNSSIWAAFLAVVRRARPSCPR